MSLRNVVAGRSSAALLLPVLMVIFFNNCSGGFTTLINYTSTELPSVELPANTLPEKAVTVLKANCLACHSSEVTYGNVSNIDDVNHLVSSGLVVPGDTDNSPLYAAVFANRMPLGRTLSEENKNILRDWIQQGAQKPSTGGEGEGDVGISETISRDSEVYSLVANDLTALKAAGKNVSTLRYFSLAHMNDGVRTLSFFTNSRHALTKVINSTSWAPQVVNPENVSSSVLIYRVDISKLQWTQSQQWQLVEARYPFRVTTEIYNTFSQRRRAVFNQLRTDLGTTVPVVHLDWFTHQASEPELYHRLLDLPTQVQALEAKLGIVAQARINGLNVIRMGTLDSDVSFYNRIIERFSTPYGGYWKSYDFSSEIAVENILERPLGPDVADSNFPAGLRFHHAGGEIIFHLPNGMQGYLLINTEGARIDTAPTTIVQDPVRVDRTVTNAISCFMCHTQGLNKTYDNYQVQLLQRTEAYDAASRAAVQQLYPTNQQMVDIFAADDSLFVASLRQMGITDLSVEHIGVTYQLYEKPMDLPAAALRLGVTTTALQASIRASETLRGFLSPLLQEGGTVASSVFEQNYGRIYILTR